MIDLAAQIVEIRQARSVIAAAYDMLVADDAMTAADAESRLRRMDAAVRTLEWLNANAVRVKQALQRPQL